MILFYNQELIEALKKKKKKLILFYVVNLIMNYSLSKNARIEIKKLFVVNFIKIKKKDLKNAINIEYANFTLQSFKVFR